MRKIDVLSHKLVPKHTILTEEEAKEVLKSFDIDANSLPKILSKDPAVKQLGAKVGDIVKIERESETAGVSVAYRKVVD
jgi:DNA-directed RNA polymerase subunit H